MRGDLGRLDNRVGTIEKNVQFEGEGRGGYGTEM